MSTILPSVITPQQVVTVDGIKPFNGTVRKHVTSFYLNDLETYNLLLSSQGKNNLLIFILKIIYTQGLGRIFYMPYIGINIKKNKFNL